MQNLSNDSGAAVFVRLRGSLYERLENWRRSQPTIPSRSDALRSLIEQALTASDGATSAAS